MDIKLTVIGSGDAFNSGVRNQTCFHLRTPSLTFLIDCGVNTLKGLKKNGLKAHEIDIIFITHLHGDHFGGLPFFLLEAAVTKRQKSLSIVAPEGCRGKLEQLSELLYPGTEILTKLTIHYHTYTTEECFTVGGLNVWALPVLHKPESVPHGLRIEMGDKIVSYSSDTEWTTTLLRLAKDADLFICECNFYEIEVKGHLNYLTLCKHLKDLECKQLLLTHFDSEMLDRMEQVKIDCAYDNMKIDI